MVSPNAANEVLMIEPTAFGHNSDTAIDNSFQHDDNSANGALIQQRALKEFHTLRERLGQAGIAVVSFQDRLEQNTPDSIFPNNWFSTHADSTLVLYPMKTESRRRERAGQALEYLRGRYSNILDLTHLERQEIFLEGTGSLVLDRTNKIAYACRSARTSVKALDEWSRIMGYQVVTFAANDSSGAAIYHTNVMMNLGQRFAIVCLEAITSSKERGAVLTSLTDSGHSVIDINFAELNSFCGNVLELSSNKDEAVIVMSTVAGSAFSKANLEKINSFGKIVDADVSTIERVGGGGARCMLAELF